MRRFPLFIIPLVGCASNPKPVTQVARTETTAAPIVTTATVSFSLSRSGIKQSISRGLGSFLREVRFEDHPVMRDGKFVGLRIESLSAAPEWREIDIHPGDVVIKVNGLSVEHPEEADFAFHSLAVASEVWVTFERNGKPREIRVPIAD